MPHEYLTAAGAAKQLGVSTATIYRWSADGTLPARRIGKAVRFDPAIIERAAREGLHLIPSQN